MTELTGLEKPAMPTKFRGVVAQFRQDAPWLTSMQEPQLAALEALAELLDGGGRSPALIGQFTLTHRALLKMAPGADGDEVDEVDDAIGNGFD